MSLSLFTCVLLKHLIPWILIKKTKLNNLISFLLINFPSKDFLSISSGWNRIQLTKQTSSQFSIHNYFDLKNIFKSIWTFCLLCWCLKLNGQLVQLHFNWSFETPSHYILDSLQVHRSASSNNVTLFWFCNHIDSGPTDTLQNFKR